MIPLACVFVCWFAFVHPRAWPLPTTARGNSPHAPLRASVCVRATGAAWPGSHDSQPHSGDADRCERRPASPPCRWYTPFNAGSPPMQPPSPSCAFARARMTASGAAWHGTQASHPHSGDADGCLRPLASPPRRRYTTTNAGSPPMQPPSPSCALARARMTAWGGAWHGTHDSQPHRGDADGCLRPPASPPRRRYTPVNAGSPPMQPPSPSCARARWRMRGLGAAWAAEHATKVRSDLAGVSCRPISADTAVKHATFRTARRAMQPPRPSCAVARDGA